MENVAIDVGTGVEIVQVEAHPVVQQAADLLKELVARNNVRIKDGVAIVRSTSAHTCKIDGVEQEIFTPHKLHITPGQLPGSYRAIGSCGTQDVSALLSDVRRAAASLGEQRRETAEIIRLSLNEETAKKIMAGAAKTEGLSVIGLMTGPSKETVHSLLVAVNPTTSLVEGYKQTVEVVTRPAKKKGEMPREETITRDAVRVVTGYGIAADKLGRTSRPNVFTL